MKILVAADAAHLESRVAKRFGEAPFYLIHDSETGELEARENHGHDESHSGLIDLVNEGILHYLVGNTGPNAFQILNELGAKLFLARGMKASEALEAYKKHELTLLDKPTLKRPIHDHGHE